MALTLFRRHTKACGKTSRRYRRCSCPISVEGSLGGEKIRKALDQTSWEAAENEIREWIKAGHIGEAGGPKRVDEAVAKFLADCVARGIKPGTLVLRKRLLEVELLAWCEDQGYRFLKELTTERMRDFRATWQNAPSTALSKLERLRCFFTFCVEAEWISKNPAKGVARPKQTATPTLPFTEEEYAALLAACDQFPHSGTHAWDTPKRIHAFVRLLRYSGLRVSDAVRLDRSKMNNGRIFLYAAKTGQPVWCPIPPEVYEEMEKIRRGREFYFWSGTGAVKSAISSWDRTLRKLAAKAKVSNAHLHRFRDTAAIGWLMGGMTIDEVAMLLGNTPRIVEKHYAPWVKERQDRLEAKLRATWPSAEVAAKRFRIIEGGA